jgi:hypothetical protein
MSGVTDGGALCGRAVEGAASFFFAAAGGAANEGVRGGQRAAAEM